MDSANMLAVGGLTDTATAVEVLLGAMNTYGKENISAAQAADTLFVAVRQGVTTVPQLSSAIGRVLPMAKAMGLSFDEAVGATAALTKNSMTTAGVGLAVLASSQIPAVGAGVCMRARLLLSS